MISNRDQAGLKVVLLGNSGTGKTSILDYVVTHISKADLQPTIGCNCTPVTVDLPTGPVHLSVWDTAGQELYRSIVPIYVRDTIAALLVYDITDEKSLDSLDHWHSVLMEEQSNSVLIYVVANKLDLPTMVPDAQGKSIAEKLEGSFHRVSAKTGEGIDELFQIVAREASTGERFQPSVIMPHTRPDGGGCC
jgi:small GTP-binding protein